MPPDFINGGLKRLIMELKETEIIIGENVAHYRNNIIRIIQSTKKHYYIQYKSHELDIGGLELSEGLLKALKWFADILIEEVQNE